MNLVLEKVQPNSALRISESELLDNNSLLMFQKEQLIAEIRERFVKREVLPHLTTISYKKTKVFPIEVYINMIDQLWAIYHEAKSTQSEQIEKIVVLVKSLLKELQTPHIYIDFHVGYLNSEMFKKPDYGTFVHVVNVALLSALTGMKLGYIDKGLEYLTLGALLHDLGKAKVPTEILHKPGRLTKEEFRIIKLHPIDGKEMLKNTSFPSSLLAAVSEHHERWDGKGYPSGLSGDSIHRDAQIIAVADVYEALTADRPYREGLSPSKVLEMIIDWAGKDFNPVVVQAFRESIILYPQDIH
jgi:putative nucleotidyltransferase with HDIG domain